MGSSGVTGTSMGVLTQSEGEAFGQNKHIVHTLHVNQDEPAVLLSFGKVSKCESNKGRLLYTDLHSP